MFKKMCSVLRPKSWKSDSQLDRNKVNRYEVNPMPNNPKNGLLSSPQLHSKSSDWTDVDLEAPEKDVIHLRNPQLSFMFNDNTTPTPPPRKHKKTLREKIETVAKNSFNALQSKKSDDTQKLDNNDKAPVDEVICIKKVIRYGCPACEGRETCIHKEAKQNVHKPPPDKEKRKSLSVISLPNYSDMKLSLTNPGDDLKYIDSSVTNSANSLPNDDNKRSSTASTAGGRFENYLTRCRSFGSLLNNKLKTPQKAPGHESDDSFGGLEEWDLGILEHYNPKDASLPRPRKPPAPAPVRLSDIEQLIVPNEEVEASQPPAPPVRPVRRSESLVQRLSVEATEAVGTASEPVEHSSLMRILQEISSNDPSNPKTTQEKKDWCKTPACSITEDFINAEKVAVS